MRDLSQLDLAELAPFHTAGVLDVADVQVAEALMRMGRFGLSSPPDVAVALGAALCVRALRAGSVCVDLSDDPTTWLPEGEQAIDLAWPTDWPQTVAAHPLVSSDRDDTPLRLSGTLLYLQRYWRDEDLLRRHMQQRSRLLQVDAQRLDAALRRLFPTGGPDWQRLAAATCALRQVTILAGGPGTGKTTTVARVIALLKDCAEVRSVALAAPTGKAAARLQEAVSVAAMDLPVSDRELLSDLSASTLHRLLGWRPDARGRFRHDASNPLPHDVVIVDETSMVSLPLMARLLEAVRPDARLMLVGDPDQLASIDAGAVMGDLVAAPAATPDPELSAALVRACPDDRVDTAASTGVVVLDRNFRFDGGIARLASAIRDGDEQMVLAALTSGEPDVEFVDPHQIAGVRSDVLAQTRAVADAARTGQAALALAGLEQHRVLCAHREGPFGVSHWDGLIDSWTHHLFDRSRDHWYPGQSLLVTANDYAAGLYNGDTGVIVSTDTGVMAAFGRGSDVDLVPVSQMGTVRTLRAMTIHRGQGSQFDAVTVILPDATSPLLTRELLYTAVTRARSRIRILGTQEAVMAAVARQVRRASGLRG